MPAWVRRSYCKGVQVGGRGRKPGLWLPFRLAPAKLPRVIRYPLMIPSSLAIL